MAALRFSWDPEKAALNLKKHHVSFPEAARAFNDRNAVILDDWTVDNEVREVLFGLIPPHLILRVSYTYRDDDQGESIRIISARKADATERKRYDEG